MKRHGFLFENVTAFDTLLRAAKNALRGKRARPDCVSYIFALERELLTLQRELLDGTYAPLPYRSFSLYEPKERKICAAPFRDRVVHHAICLALNPVFEGHFIHDTYACRAGKGVHAAVKRVQQLSRRSRFYMACDIRRFYEHIDHGRLKHLLHRKLKDRQFCALLDLIIDHPVPGLEPGRGIPIGNLTSQYFANFYLSGFDHYVKEVLRAEGYVRYMDDFILFSDSKACLKEALPRISAWLRDNLALLIKEKALVRAPVTGGITFLGFRIYPGMVRLTGAKWRAFVRKSRALHAAHSTGHIGEETLNASLAAMTAHIVHAGTLQARRTLFSRYSSWG
jgi:hypothetical protein